MWTLEIAIQMKKAVYGRMGAQPGIAGRCSRQRRRKKKRKKLVRMEAARR